MAVAVLIVNYRGYQDLAACLTSLTPHLRRGDQLIVVDNESQALRLQEITSAFPQVLALPCSENLGFSAGVNLAASAADADYLLLLNPDTELSVAPNLLTAMEQWMDRHPDVAVTGPRVLNIDGSTQPSARSFPDLTTLFGGRTTWLTKRIPDNWLTRRNLLGLHSSEPTDVDWVAGSCLMTRRAVFEQLGGLDPRFFMYWEDADYCRRAKASGGRSVYLPFVSLLHRCGGSARYSLPRAIRSFHSSAFQLYWKHAGPIGRVFAPAVRLGLLVRAEIRLRAALRGRERAESITPRTPALAADLRGNAMPQTSGTARMTIR